MNNRFDSLVDRLSREPEKSLLEVATQLSPMDVSAWLDREFAEFGPEGGAEEAFANVARELETGLLRHLNLRLMLDAAANGNAESAGRYLVAAIREAAAREAISVSNGRRWLAPLRAALEASARDLRAAS